jgi:hypothetical protein
MIPGAWSQVKKEPCISRYTSKFFVNPQKFLEANPESDASAARIETPS